jgi:hypothetical protein
MPQHQTACEDIQKRHGQEHLQKPGPATLTATIRARRLYLPCRAAEFMNPTGLQIVSTVSARARACTI